MFTDPATTASPARPRCRPTAWSHVATTCDGTTLRLFVDGARGLEPWPLSGPITVSGGALRIGGNAVWAEWFDGTIDEVRVYNRALSPEQIARRPRHADRQGLGLRALAGREAQGAADEAHGPLEEALGRVELARPPRPLPRRQVVAGSPNYGNLICIVPAGSNRAGRTRLGAAGDALGQRAEGDRGSQSADNRIRRLLRVRSCPRAPRPRRSSRRLPTPTPAVTAGGGVTVASSPASVARLACARELRHRRRGAPGFDAARARQDALARGPGGLPGRRGRAGRHRRRDVGEAQDVGRRARAVRRRGRPGGGRRPRRRLLGPVARRRSPSRRRPRERARGSSSPSARRASTTARRSPPR